MKKAPKFPNLLHVRIEEPANDEPYFVVEDRGPLGSVVEETTPMAMYKLVGVGKLVVSRTFEAKAVK